MIWLAKNLVGGVLLPPCNFLLLQILALVFWRRRPWLARVALVGSLGGLVVCTMPATAGWMIELVERNQDSVNLEDADLASRADAIVVLGGGRVFGAREYGGSRVSLAPNSLLRLRYAMELARKTGKPLLLTGGTPGAPGPSEAELMNRALREEFGAQASWIEDRARNTAENAELSWRMLSAQKPAVSRVFLVTSAWHMPRAARSFRKAGFTVVAAPMGFLSDRCDVDSALSWIPSSRGLEMSYLAMHEGIGAVWYRLQGVN